MNYVKQIIQQTIATKNFDSAFYVLDVEDIIEKHNKWLSKMPRIKSYYAVKANKTPIVLELLASLGLGFDCASKNEIADVMSHGASANKIIYAHTCKLKSYIEYAKSVNVDLMTFDSEEELYKIAECAPEAKLVLRIKVDDSHATIKLSTKFGVDVKSVPSLFQVAKHLKLNVVGVCFHIGSGCDSSEPFIDSIEKAAHVFKIAKDYGFDMHMLDIGAGFPGATGSKNALLFDEMAQVVNDAIDKYFPPEMNVDVIAEPGRYYVSSAFTLTTMIIAKRKEITDEQIVMNYFINDGRHGSFPYNFFGENETVPIALIEENHSRKMYNSVIWGQTCDGFDYIRTSVVLPEMNVGEWMTFENMGAYTSVLGTTFNGFEMPIMKYYASENTIEVLRNLPAWQRICKYLSVHNSLSSNSMNGSI